MSCWTWACWTQPLPQSARDEWTFYIVAITFVLAFGIMAVGSISAHATANRLNRERDENIARRRAAWAAAGKPGLPPPEPGDFVEHIVI